MKAEDKFKFTKVVQEFNNELNKTTKTVDELSKVLKKIKRRTLKYRPITAEQHRKHIKDRIDLKLKT